jgi:hypothetical protein
LARPLSQGGGRIAKVKRNIVLMSYSFEKKSKYFFWIVTTPGALSTILKLFTAQGLTVGQLNPTLFAIRLVNKSSKPRNFTSSFHDSRLI